MLADTHCHLNFPDYDTDLSEVIKRSIDNGVGKIICASSNLADSIKAIEIANKFPQIVYASVGIHPQEVEEFSRDALQCVSTLKKLAQQQKKVVAIGETGLDYHESPGFPIITEEVKQKQKELFLAQIKISQEFNLPLIVHCREAWEDIVVMLYNITTEEKKIKGVFHCYSGGKKWLKKVLELGFYFGIDGNVTYDEGLQNVVKEIPLDKILLETDSPFLTPVPFRGQRNEPKNISLIAEWITRIKNIPLEELEKQIIGNTKMLFGFEF